MELLLHNCWPAIGPVAFAGRQAGGNANSQIGAAVNNYFFAVDMPDIMFVDEEKRFVRVEPMVTIGEVQIQFYIFVTGKSFTTTYTA